MSTPVYHKDFSDPTADLVIKCEDGVHFRVHSYILKAHSLYFREMPDHSSEISGTSEKIIDLDAKSEDLALLLHTVGIEQTHEAVKWDRLESMLDLGARYNFIRLPETARLRTLAAIDGQFAWAAFRYASQHSDIDLARTALTQLGLDHKLRDRDVEDVDVSIFEGIPGVYVGAFMQALGDVPYKSMSENRWAAIAKRFRI